MKQANYAIFKQTIEQVMQGHEKLPSLPDITLRIRREIATPNTTTAKIAALAAADPSVVVMLMRHASGPLYRTQEAPKSLAAAISLLGITTVDRLIMLHSIKSLFIIKSPGLKQLFAITWQRQALKAATSRFLAQKVGLYPADEALIACLLSEIGTLAILSALSDLSEPPSSPTYLTLCRRYSKSLGIIILKKWDMDGSYGEVVRRCGDWSYPNDGPLNITDIINLALYHTVALMKKQNDLPPITELPAYRKLSVSFNQCGNDGLLSILSSNKKEIISVARSLT